MEGQGAIYNSFYTILTYFFPADIVSQYSQVFVFVAVVSVLCFAFWIIKSIKKLLGGN
jgi:hypothetical protein